MSRIKVGVVGVGAIGVNHARVYGELEQAELAAVYDLDRGAAEAVVAKHGGVVAEDLDEFVELVDGATVATPTNTHLEVGRRLLAAGKHVLVEKPIATNREEADELVTLAHEKGCVLQVGHIERFNPVMSRLEEIVSHPRFIESHRLSPFPNRSVDIGVVLDLMIHDLEIILHLVRSPVASIDAVGVPVLTKREDIANARLRFENGCVANVTVSRISPERMRKMRIFQEDAYLSLDYQDQAGEIYRREGTEIKRETVEVEKDEPLKLELSAFVDCAAKGVRPKVSGYEAAAALDAALEITGLIESGYAAALAREGG
ncbi:MAG: Gfo/Idh/MocA family oxidoreductase [Verrucomicrobiota bacterium]